MQGKNCQARTGSSANGCDCHAISKGNQETCRVVTSHSENTCPSLRTVPKRQRLLCFIVLSLVQLCRFLIFRFIRAIVHPGVTFSMSDTTSDPVVPLRVTGLRK